MIRGEKSLKTNNERPHYLTWLVYRYIIRTTYSCGVPKPWVGDSQQWSSGPAFRVPGVTKFPPCNDWLAHGTAMGFHQHQPASLKNLLSLCTCEPEHPKGRVLQGPTNRIFQFIINKEKDKSFSTTSGTIRVEREMPSLQWQSYP